MKTNSATTPFLLSFAGSMSALLAALHAQSSAGGIREWLWSIQSCFSLPLGLLKLSPCSALGHLLLWPCCSLCCTPLCAAFCPFLNHFSQGTAILTAGPGRALAVGLLGPASDRPSIASRSGPAAPRCQRLGTCTQPVLHKDRKVRYLLLWAQFSLR